MSRLAEHTSRFNGGAGVMAEVVAMLEVVIAWPRGRS